MANVSAPNFSGSVVNLEALKEHTSSELLDLLDNVRGKKALVMDPDLTGPLGLVIDVALLKSHGVERIFHLQSPPLTTDCKNIVYICRPKIEYMKHIADHVHDHTANNIYREYTVLFVPRKTLICERVLEDEGVLGNIQMGEFHLDLMPFDTDVLSLELPNAFRECYLDGDQSAWFYVALALMKVQAMFGVVPEILGVGDGARAVADMMLRMRQELGANENTIAPEIDRIILLDRNVDMVTPLLTQLTYEGLIDETMGINNTLVELDPEIVATKGGAPSTARKVIQQLNGGDSLYAEIRDINFSVIGPLLNHKAQYINDGYEKRHQAETMHEIKEYVSMFKGLQQEHKSLGIHTNISLKIRETTNSLSFHRNLEAEQYTLRGDDISESLTYVEDLIGRQEPLVKVLRVLCLLSLTLNGLREKVFDNLRREIVQTYGFEHMFTLDNLARLGLLKKSAGRPSWPTVRNSLDLIHDDLDENNPDDIAYVYSGYAPLSCRLIQYASSPGWSALGSVLGMLNGPVFEEVQELPEGIRADDDPTRPRVTLVFFIGGCTHAEISAIRFLSQTQSLASGHQEDYIIATTKLTNGSTLLSSLLSSLDNAISGVGTSGGAADEGTSTS